MFTPDGERDLQIVYNIPHSPQNTQLYCINNRRYDVIRGRLLRNAYPERIFKYNNGTTLIEVFSELIGFVGWVDSSITLKKFNVFIKNYEHFFNLVEITDKIPTEYENATHITPSFTQSTLPTWSISITPPTYAPPPQSNQPLDSVGDAPADQACQVCQFSPQPIPATESPPPTIFAHTTPLDTPAFMDNQLIPHNELCNKNLKIITNEFFELTEMYDALETKIKDLAINDTPEH